MEQAQPPPAAISPPAPTGPPVAPPPPQAGPAAVATGLLAGLDPTTRRPTLIVAALIAGLFFGSQILNEAIPANAGGNGGAPGTPVAIGEASRIIPLAGWSTGRLEGGGLRVEKGFVAVDLFESGFAGAAADLAQAYVDEILRPAATQLSASSPQVATGDGGSAARLTYSGIFTGADGTIEGEVTVFVLPGGAVVADAWAPLGRLAALLPEVHDMLDTIEVQR